MPLKDIGVDRWQHDVWFRIIEAALNGHPDQPRLSDLPGFDQPAASRYAATTPQLLRWFNKYNADRDDPYKVRPFNFLTAFTPKRSDRSDQTAPHASGKRKGRDRIDLPRPIAPYHTNPRRAAANCFDRVTGATLEASFVRVLPKDSNQRVKLSYADIAALAFSGRDPAAGKSWEAWVQKYWSKKTTGEGEASLQPDALE